MDYNLIFTAILGGTILFAVLRGYLRGYRKSLYYLIVTLIFYVVFFVTLNTVTQLIYTSPLPGLELAGDVAGPTLEVTIDNVLDESLGDDFAFLTDNPESAAFFESVALFAVKLVWALLYFTVVSVFYWLITRLVGLIFVRVPREEGSRKKIRKRGMGAVVGALHGIAAVSMLLILLGGVMNINQSLLVIIDAFEGQEATVQESDIQMLNDPLDDIEGIDDLREVVDGFVNNPIVKAFDQVAFGGTPYYLLLFDQIFSLDYEEVNIPIRRELAIIADITTLFAGDEIDPATLEPTAISDAFNRLADSKLVEAFMPVAVRALVAEFGDDEIDLSPLEGLNWNDEIRELGQILSLAVGVMQQANVFDENEAISTVALDRDDVVDLFEALGASNVIAISLEAGFDFFLRDAEPPVSLILVWPEDLDFAAEMSAVGQIVVALIEADVTFDTLEEDEAFDFITPLLGFDFTLLLDSRLITEALIRVFDGTAEIEALEMLEVPSNIEWRDTVVGDNIIAKGELRLMFEALNALLDKFTDFDFENPSLEIIADFDEELIDIIFDSRVILATISTQLTNLDLEGTPLVLPDSATDAEGYLTKAEMVTLANGLRLVFDVMLSSEDGFDVDAILNLSDEAFDALLDSQIITATLGRVLLDLVDNDTLKVPQSVITTVFVNGAPVQVVSDDEVRDIVDALKLLGLSALTSLDFSANIFSVFTDETTGEIDESKLDIFFASEIIHATLSDFLISSLEGTLSVPHFDANGTAIRTTEDGLEYISRDELKAVFQAIATTGLLDFENVDNINVNTLLSDLSTILESAIFHATISSQVEGVITNIGLPENTRGGDPMLITVGTGLQATTYIDADELVALFDAFELLGFGDLENATTSFDLTLLSGTANQANRDTFFASTILYAAFSDLMIGANSGILIIPDGTQETLHGTNYITRPEVDAFLIAIHELGIGGLDNTEFNLNSLFSADLDLLFDSAIIHATVSKFILDAATDESAPDDATLIVPSALREAISVNGSPAQRIERSELEALIAALDVLGFGDYGDGVDPLAITSLNETELTTVFQSGSMHYSADDLILDGATLDVPDLAKDTYPYGTLISVEELVKLIVASQVFGKDDYSTFNVTLPELNALSPAEREVVVESMVVRNLLTPEIEALADVSPTFELEATDYENNDVTTFLSVAGMERALDELS